MAALTDVHSGFGAAATAHARRSAVAVIAGGQSTTSFVLVRAAEASIRPSSRRASRCKRGYWALTSEGLRLATIGFVIANTGIAFSFGVMIALGALVGVLVAGLTFSLFANENLRQFAVLKAVSLLNGHLGGIMLAQGAKVAGICYAIGPRIASSFFDAVNQPLSDLGCFYLPWQVAALVEGAVRGIVLLSAAVSLRHVLALHPAVAFRG